MNIHFFGHSVVYLETSTAKIVIDPFIQGNPKCPIGVDDIQPDFVILTHAHGDHWGNTMEYAKRGAMILSTAEIVGYAQKLDPKIQGRPMNNGGAATLPFGKLKFTNAWHSSSFPDGTYGGTPMGVLLEVDGKRIHHAGDTALFSDLGMLKKLNVDVSFLPIGDNFTMGPDDALEAVELIKPKLVVPIHYNTFGLIEQDGDQFVSRAENLGVKGLALKPGGKLEL
jgi:L-ascorbate metabolism protein UlaG (beta-lactamase superfamily)